jgi:hypothetical protein
MRNHRHLQLLGLALLLPQLGGAQLPISNEVFGKAESFLDSCAKANPNHPDKYEKLRKEVVKDAAESEQVDARKTQEYKDAYEKEKTELAKMPKVRVVEVCSAIGNEK